MRWIILDTETTGLNASTGDRIIELAAIEVVNRNLTGRDFHTYLKPDRDSHPEALQIHGITTEFLADKPRFEDVIDDFLDFIEGSELIIHNAPFDVRFLNAELQRIDRGVITDYCLEVTDSLAFAKALYPGKRNSLDALCDRYGVSNAHRTLHGALLDSQLLAEVWLAMTRGQDSLLDDPHDLSTNDLSSQRLQRRAAVDLLVLEPTDEELADHQAYLDALDKSVKGTCVWRKIEAQ
jgi:DNA polymerase-3 subunit epsilon